MLTVPTVVIVPDAAPPVVPPFPWSLHCAPSNFAILRLGRFITSLTAFQLKVTFTLDVPPLRSSTQYSSWLNTQSERSLVEPYTEQGFELKYSAVKWSVINAGAEILMGR